MNAENSGIPNKDGMDKLSFGDDSYLVGEEVVKGWPSPINVYKFAKNYFKNKRKRERDKSARLYVVLLVLACLVSGVFGAVLSKLSIHFGSYEWFLITGISLLGNLVNWFLCFKIGFGKND
jgi:hypothetical protein